jgi:hypothetical protein
MKKIITILAAIICVNVNAQICFNIDSNFVQGGDPHQVISADFNNDGNIDLATANYSANSISILLGTGTGSFGSSINISVSGYPISIAGSDFNGDGKIDGHG